MTASFLKGKEALLKWLANNGFAVCVALLLFWMISSAVAWIATELAIPARDRFFVHLDAVEKMWREKLDAIKDAIVKQENAIRDVEQQQQKHQLTTERVAASTSKMADSLEQTNDVLQQIRDAKVVPADRAASVGAKAADATKHPAEVSIRPGG